MKINRKIVFFGVAVVILIVLSASCAVPPSQENINYNSTENLSDYNPAQNTPPLDIKPIGILHAGTARFYLFRIADSKGFCYVTVPYVENGDYSNIAITQSCH